MYIFSFSFSEESSVKYQSQSHWLNWKWMSSATNLPQPYLFLDFQREFPAQEKSGSFPYRAYWIHWIPRDSTDPRKTVDSQPQYVFVRKIHTPSNRLLMYANLNTCEKIENNNKNDKIRASSTSPGWIRYSFLKDSKNPQFWTWKMP